MSQPKIQITVTREHWDRGVAEAYPIMKEHVENPEGFGAATYCTTCVLAQAIKDSGHKVSVGKASCTIDGLKYKLPKEAKEIITAFDMNETFMRTGRKQEGFVEPAFPITFVAEAM